ncbi:hypothetical protein yaldo0001_40880, partial [Yersinia aldovae ATCC 35236]|uniref:Uncharacterized protein n=1 Tax=Yersinia aldovae TaxID=29483 RepID=A0A0T9UXS1_YERAL
MVLFRKVVQIFVYLFCLMFIGLSALSVVRAVVLASLLSMVTTPGLL